MAALLTTVGRATNISALGKPFHLPYALERDALIVEGTYGFNQVGGFFIPIGTATFACPFRL